MKVLIAIIVFVGSELVSEVAVSMPPDSSSLPLAVFKADLKNVRKSLLHKQDPSAHAGIALGGHIVLSGHMEDGTKNFAIDQDVNNVRIADFKAVRLCKRTLSTVLPKSTKTFLCDTNGDKLRYDDLYTTNLEQAEGVQAEPVVQYATYEAFKDIIKLAHEAITKSPEYEEEEHFEVKIIFQFNKYGTGIRGSHQGTFFSFHDLVFLHKDDGCTYKNKKEKIGNKRINHEKVTYETDTGVFTTLSKKIFDSTNTFAVLLQSVNLTPECKAARTCNPKIICKNDDWTVHAYQVPVVHIANAT